MGARIKFSSAVCGRGAEILALKRAGLTWDGVASHFGSDAYLGGRTGDHFASSWSKQARRGFGVRELAVDAAFGDLLRWLRGRGSMAGWMVVSEDGRASPAFPASGWACGDASRGSRFPLSLAGRFFWFAGVASSGRPLVHAR